MGRHSRPKLRAMSSISAVASQPAASILLTMINRHLSAAAAIMRRVTLSMPEDASISTAPVSAAPSADSARPARSGRPGVSIRLIQCPSRSRCTTAADSEWPISRSSGSKSVCVVPRSTLPAAPISPAATSRASTRLVLPQPACPSRAMLRTSCTEAGVMANTSGGTCPVQFPPVRAPMQWAQTTTAPAGAVVQGRSGRCRSARGRRLGLAPPVVQ